MKHKTVAIVINTSWNIYNFRIGLLRALQEEGYRVVAIAPEDAYAARLEALGIEHYDVKINNKGTSPIEDLKLLFAFREHYQKIAPDVILHYTIKPNIYGSMAAGMLGIPVIGNISGLGTLFIHEGFSSKAARFLYKIALKVPRKIFFQNAYDRALFIDSRLVPAEKTDLLPGSGIDTEKFKPQNVKNDSKGGVRFLFIARLVRDKGLTEYVEAARQLLQDESFGQGRHGIKPEFHILGAYYPGNPTAVTEEEMQQWEEEGIVTYLGTSDNVKMVISEHDCVVLPSYREGLSRVLLEAASMAKPLITTDVPGCREVVDDGVNGYLCQVRDPEALAGVMRKMCRLDEHERSAMGVKGRQKVMEIFAEERVIKKYLDAIEDIFSQRC